MSKVLLTEHRDCASAFSSAHQERVSYIGTLYLSKTKSYKSIGISGNPKNIAKKIINSIGRKSANQIANQILEAIKNDR